MSLKGTILLRLSCGRPQFRRLDRELSAETQHNNHMSEDAGNFNKVLLPNKHLKTWDQNINALRSRFYELTSPYDDSGYRVCTPLAFFEFQRYYSEHKQVLDTFKDSFIREYPDLVEQQRTRLGNAFAHAEFPQVNNFADKFKVETDVSSLPETGTLFHLGEEEEKRIVEKAEARLDEAHRGNYERLLKVLSHLTSTLRDEDRLKNCRSTTLSNVQELAATIPMLNFKEDTLLNEMAKKVEDMCTELSIQELKKSKVTRTSVVSSAEEAVRDIEDALCLYAG